MMFLLDVCLPAGRHWRKLFLGVPLAEPVAPGALRSVDHQRTEGLPARIQTELQKLDWGQDARVRLRGHGQVFFGEAFIALED